MPTNDKKCSHVGCPCPADPGSDYCSERCREAADGVPNGECACDHALCRQSRQAAEVRRSSKDKVSGSYDPRTAKQDAEKPLLDDWGRGDKH
jgi:hypothetical protein